MLNSNLNTEKHDLLITPNLQPNQLPTLLEQALSVAPAGETRDMLLLSLLTNCAYALPAMRILHGRPALSISLWESGVICSYTRHCK